MKHVSYTIPGVVDDEGEPVVFGGFPDPGMAFPGQSVLPDGRTIATPPTAQSFFEAKVNIPDFLPEVGLNR